MSSGLQGRLTRLPSALSLSDDWCVMANRHHASPSAILLPMTDHPLLVTHHSSLIRCPGCGGRNPRDALSCEWCHRPLVQVPGRGPSARWWGAVSGLLVIVLLLLIGVLAFLNTTRSTGRASDPAPAAAPSPVLVASPSPVADKSTPAPASPVPTQAAAPAPPTSPAPAAEARSARIANTDGRGANLRREPSSASALVAAADENSTVRLLGPEQRGPDGRLWQQVEDGRGNQGWVMADLLVEAR